MPIKILALWITLMVVGAASAQERTYRKLEIENAQFTQDHVGVLQLELEKVANYLAVYSYRTFAKEIREGKAESRLRARRYISLALHMDTGNVTAKRINEMLANGTEEELEGPLSQTPKVFVAALVRLIKRLQERTEPAAGRLGGFLALVAAELDPTNEDAIYAAELFERALGDVTAAWKVLALGKGANEEATESSGGKGP
jgi:hypothetical protein